MAINYLDHLRTQQKKVSDLLAGQDAAIEPGLAKTRAAIGTARKRYTGDVQDVLGAVGSQYGISTGTAPSGQDRTLDRQLEEGLDRRRMGEKMRVSSLVFNTAFDNFVQAGNDTQTAYAKARQFALDKSDQTFKAGESAKDRASKKQMADMADQYQSLYQPMSSNDPYEQAVISSLFNVAGQAGTAWALGAFGDGGGGSKTATKGSGFNTYYDPASIRTKSLFGGRD